jgi:hypothetical protein
MSADAKSELNEDTSRYLVIQQLILIIDEGWPENVKQVFTFIFYITSNV